jgi:hypothetical protein
MDSGLFSALTRVRDARTLRASSYEVNGRNGDRWIIAPGETRILADLKGPGCITHIWMTQGGRTTFRDVLLKMYWDGEDQPSVLVPLGDFFCLGHNIINSFCSLPFSSSTAPGRANHVGASAALNCYLQMPFRKSARIEVTNEGKDPYGQYFYVDYERYARALDPDVAYFHARFHRENPCDGWGHEIRVNTPEANIANRGRLAWDTNYVILEAEGRGHYIGCNLSVTNFQGTWWGEGDDMIWVDGYRWPPDLHGTGSEDYLNQAWGMQDNAFLRNGSSIFEGRTTLSYSQDPWGEGAYQTSYVFHLENPVRFQREIKVTIEHGHANDLNNEASSVAYWYADRPTRTVKPPPVAKRLPVRRDNQGRWLYDRSNQCPGRPVQLTDEMKA